MSTMLNLRIDDETKEKLDQLAKSTARTRTHLVRKAIDEYLEANEWQIQEIEKAVKQADRPDAGFIDHEKVAAWLDSWGTENEQEPPK